MKKVNVISFGKKSGVKTAEVVVDGETKHLHKEETFYTNKDGKKYKI